MSWRDYAPFKEFWLSDEAPLPDIVVQAIVALVLLLFIGGLVISVRRNPGLLIAGVAFIGFVVYLNSTILHSYFMRYLPPFTALFFIVAGYGLSELAGKAPRPAIALGMILALSYGFHIPFSMPLDKKVQETRPRAAPSLALRNALSDRQ